MADNLPLIPTKRGNYASDVRPVLRAVFRERAAHLPPLLATPPPATNTNELNEHEETLREQRARRLARKPQDNTYALFELPSNPPIHITCTKHPMLERSDLMPHIENHATRDTSLWVKNVLNRSSGDITEMDVCGTKYQRTRELLAVSECRSFQSTSIGDVVVAAPPPRMPQLSRPPLPENVIVVPTKIFFINFIPGKEHTQKFRLVNVSMTEVRVSMRPPTKKGLFLELRNRLKITSGASIEIIVHFIPQNSLAVYDEINIRVSAGRAINIPIACYMQPPILDVITPNLPSTFMMCLDEQSTVSDGDLMKTGKIEQELFDMGAKLLGYTHYMSLILQCSEDHAIFCAMSEDSWISNSLTGAMSTGSLMVGPFVWSPLFWHGGANGTVDGWVACRAPKVGMHSASLRLVTTTGIARPLTIIADALYFYPSHISLKAKEKDFDIFSEDDADCEHYINIGTCFPHRSLSSSVTIFNHSPITYSYYWSVRLWGKCSCWEEELLAEDWLGAEDDPERLCAGARIRRKEELNKNEKNDETYESSSYTISQEKEMDGGGNVESLKQTQRSLQVDMLKEAAAAVRVSTVQGVLAPRCSEEVVISVPDAGKRHGVQRAVLRLVITGVPQRSFPPGYYPMIVSKYTVPGMIVHGLKHEECVICDVVCCQLEVWWQVTPVRFVLDPPLLYLPTSRRMKSVKLELRKTQLYSGGTIHVQFGTDVLGMALPSPCDLDPHQPTYVPLTLPLRDLPNESPVTEIITLNADNDEWTSQALVTRYFITRHPALAPDFIWLGYVPPAAHLRSSLKLTNDTYQDTYWWADVFRLLRERKPKDICLIKCDRCHDKTCTCDILGPSRGFLKRFETATLIYDTIAPCDDGLVATMVRVRRTEAGIASIPCAPAVNARASLFTYSVLAPKVFMRVTTCGGCEGSLSKCCTMKMENGPVLQIPIPLECGLRTCYKLHFYNISPMSTRITWLPPPSEEEQIKTTFIPNRFDMHAYSERTIRLAIDARRVCGRRVWIRAAKVEHRDAPIFLMIDACISGLEVDYCMPFVDHSFCLRRSQREVLPWMNPVPANMDEAFLWGDDKTEARRICQCKPQMTWVPPPKSSVEPRPVEIVYTAPPLTRLCECCKLPRPLIPLQAPLTLEVRELPLNTVRTVCVQMRNVCSLSGRWTACARLGATAPPRTLLKDGGWATMVRPSGLAVRLSPSGGMLLSRAIQDLQIRVYSDTWGVYRDQILIMTDSLEPFVVNIWIEVIGNPLKFVLNPTGGAEHYSEKLPTLWVSEEDPDHTVIAKNTSRAPVLIEAYLLCDNEHIQDSYPFRLCIRMFDVPHRLSVGVCPCSFTGDESIVSEAGESRATGSVSSEPMDTGIKVYLAPDYGPQDSEYFTVEPKTLEVKPGEVGQWNVTAIQPIPQPLIPRPSHTLLLRTIPLKPRGPWWYRGEPPPAAVRIRNVWRTPKLHFSEDTIVAHLCGIALTSNGIMRIRKRLFIQNQGNGQIEVSAQIDPETKTADEEQFDARKTTIKESNSTSNSAVNDGLKEVLPGPVWSFVCSEGHTDSCPKRVYGLRSQQTQFKMPAHSTTDICVEVCARSDDICPQTVEKPRWDEAMEGRVTPRPSYEEERNFTSSLQFYDDYNVLKTVSLILHLETPRLLAHPKQLDLGYVCDEDTRKSFFTVSHSSRHETITVHTEVESDAEFRVHPGSLLLPPGVKHNVYVIHTSRYNRETDECCVWVRADGAAGAWCSVAVLVRARPTRDFKCHLPPHDHTDDPTLLPTNLIGCPSK